MKVCELLSAHDIDAAEFSIEKGSIFYLTTRK